MNDEKRTKIRRAAFDVFLRYGYRRTTMDDIAREVGMSRPALYLVHPGKEAVFCDVVEVGLDEILQTIEAGLAAQPTVEDKLRHVFEVSSVRSFELVSRAPAAGELMNASFDFAKDIFDRYDQRLATIVAEIIRSAVPDAGTLQPTAAARARVMIAAAHGFKSTAKDGQEMRALIDELVRMVVARLPATRTARVSKAKRPTPRRTR